MNKKLQSLRMLHVLMLAPLMKTKLKKLFKIIALAITPKGSVVCVADPVGYSQKKNGWVCATHFLKPLPYFRPKCTIFPILFQTYLS